MSKEMTEPTGEGKRRYPPNGTYEDYPCTCSTECDVICKGNPPCGCEACHASYMDFLSGE